MTTNHSLRRYLAAFVCCAFASTALFGPSAQAAFIGTDRVLAEQAGVAAEQARGRIDGLLAREDIASRLVAYGVDPKAARLRVAAMTDAEIVSLQQRIDELPAGGDLLGVAALIFIVLVITDAIGATDVFTFVDKVD